MTEGTKALRAVKLWDAWGRALARGACELATLAVADAPRIAAQRPATRIRLGLSHHPAHAQLTLELRVDFGAAAKRIFPR